MVLPHIYCDGLGKDLYLNLPGKAFLFLGIRKAVSTQSSAVGRFRDCTGFSGLPQPKSCCWWCGPHPRIKCTGSMETHSF